MDALSHHGFSFRFQDGLAFAERHRVVLVQAVDGTPVDISLGMLPFELEVIDRADAERPRQDFDLPIATVEDLIIMKLVAGRPRDIDDVRALAAIHPLIDRQRVESFIHEFSAILEQPEIYERFRTLLSR